jgi:outer membrane protein TolC
MRAEAQALRLPVARRTIAIVVVVWLTALPAYAAGPALSLGEALRLAVERSPQLDAQRALAAGASAGIVAAGALPDPKLKTTLDNVPTNTEERWTAKDPVTMLKVGLSQEFPGYTKLDLRTLRAERDARRESVMIEVQQAAVQREVAMAWVARYFADRAEAKVTEQIAEAELAVEAGGAQYRAGKATQAEILTLQSAVVELKNRRTEIGLQIRQAKLALGRIIGADAERPVGDAPDMSRLPTAVADVVDAEDYPEVRAALAQERVAAAEADLAGAETWPDWKVEFTYSWRGRAPIFILPFQGQVGGTPYAQLLSLEVTVDLPLFSSTRQKPRYEAKLKGLDAARALREDAKRKQTAEVQSTIAEWESARAQAGRIRDQLIPLAVQGREAAMAAYRGGTGTLSALLEARRTELEVRLNLIQQEQAAGKAWAWLAFVFPVTEKS